jgi:hypothetical protein
MLGGGCRARGGRGEELVPVLMSERWNRALSEGQGGGRSSSRGGARGDGRSSSWGGAHVGVGEDLIAAATRGA